MANEIRLAAMDLTEQLRSEVKNMEIFLQTAKVLFGEELLATWANNGNYERMIMALQENMDVFRNAETTGEGLMNRMFDMWKAGALREKDGTDLLNYTELDGSYQFAPKPQSMYEVARRMEISPFVLLAALTSIKNAQKNTIVGTEETK